MLIILKISYSDPMMLLNLERTHLKTEKNHTYWQTSNDPGCSVIFENLKLKFRQFYLRLTRKILIA